MRFFFDNNLPPKLARCLHALVEPEHQVVHLKERFAANTPDETWIRALAGETKWSIVSGDIRIGRNPHEREAWRSAGHTIFFLKPGWIHLPFWVQAQKFVKCFPQIMEIASSAKPGSMYYLGVNGKIES